jgi:subtilisin family serine protease
MALSLLALLILAAAGPDLPSVAAADGLETLEQAVSVGRLDVEVLQTLGRDGRVDAMVTFDDRAALERASQAGGPSAIAEQLAWELRQLKAPALQLLAIDDGVLRDFQFVGSTFARVSSPALLLALLNTAGVSGVRATLVAYPADTESNALIRQPAVAADGYRGAGTAVAVLDTGVDYTRSAFGSCSSPGGGCKVVQAQDIALEDGKRDDSSYHGTNVAGIVLAVAPSTRIVALDVFRSDGQTTSVELSAALDWVIGHQSTYNIRAVNLSLGGGAYSGVCAPDPGFQSALAVGITPVVAAGNSGSVNGVAWPACVSGAISVGAVYDDDLGPRSYSMCSDATSAPDKIACFSQSGANLTMLAPGARITAAGISMAGTSQATPHVAGAAAVLAAAKPSASQAALRSALADTGRAIKDPRNGLTRRRLDMVAAVAALTAPAPSPTPTPDTTPPRVKSKSPNWGQTGISRWTSVVVTFTERVRGVSSASFKLRNKATGSFVSVTVTYDSAARTATLKPASRLAARTAYIAYLTSAITDRAGNRLSAQSWTFTTR